MTALITGSTGFIGGAVKAALACDPRVRLRCLVRDPARITDPRSADVVADLTMPDTLAGSCEGVETVVHAATYTGADLVRCHQVNVLGTRNLLAEARRAGVRRVVYVSTAGVYGTGPHRGEAVGDLVPAPESPASATRLAAERMVLSAGGHVLRPHLVYGPGDRWVVPTLGRLLPALPGWIEGGAARMSVIAVHDLARVAAAVTTTGAVLRPGVHHVNHPDPVSARALGEALAAGLGVPVPALTVTRADLARFALPDGVRPRHLDMLALDHHYDSRPIWTDLGVAPGRTLQEHIPNLSDWYPDMVRAAQPRS